MKKSTKSLKLKAETIRTLKDAEIDLAVGAGYVVTRQAICSGAAQCTIVGCGLSVSNCGC